MNKSLLSVLLLIAIYMFSLYVILVEFIHLFPVAGAIYLAFASTTLIPMLYITYRFRNGIEKSEHSLKIPTLNGHVSIVKSDIQGFEIEKNYLGRVGDYVNLTIYLKSGSKVHCKLPDFIVEQAQKEVNLGVE